MDALLRHQFFGPMSVSAIPEQVMDTDNQICRRCGCFRSAHGEGERCEPVGWSFEPMDTDNREIVILNARSIAKRERNIGHPEVAAIIEDLASQLSGVVGLRAALEPFAALARPKTWPDAPGETGPSRIDVIEGKGGTGELYLGTHFGTARKITLWRDDFEQALAALNNTGGQSDGAAVP